MRKLIFALSIFFLIISCEKEQVVKEEKKSEIQLMMEDPELEFVYFKSGETEYFFPEELVLPDFSNRYLSATDQLNIDMTGGNNQYDCNLFFLGGNLLQRTLPYVLDEHSVSTIDGSVELQLIDDYDGIQFSPEDDVNYYASTRYGTLTLTIISYINRVLVCEFHGVLGTKAGDNNISVENGQLRIKLHEPI